MLYRLNHPVFSTAKPEELPPPASEARVPCALRAACLHAACTQHRSIAFRERRTDTHARTRSPSPQMVGCDALGAMKAPFYELLCSRAAPKNEALFAALRGQVTRMNAMLPGSKRLCVHARTHALHCTPSPHARASTHPSADALVCLRPGCTLFRWTRLR
jgi:hypothetical protein